MLKLCLILILALTLIIGLPGCNLAKRSELEIAVSVSQLIADYEENELAADKKYAGRTLILSGQTSHYAQLHGVIGVYLKSPNSASKWQIICFIDSTSNPNAYSRLGEEKDVTFIGTGESQINKFSIYINDCQFAK